ncbi:hypothetical protein JG688_00003067 [Phytophthora aleatoria]|uniref:Uncharacterized protein n=1 Tax=Phytophthora aleatoria TaxID=2496075 RepID=A0A8J5MAB1_9STRA|nr:hypothetical protein JG688_00003067 [Phytophthora aleatoria]
MGKSDTSIAAEFFKLELLLIETADDAAKSAKALKTNFAAYDSRHGLHFVNTSKSFMRGNIRTAKDAAAELRLVADQIAKSKFLTDWEIAAARNKMNATADAIKELKKQARVYDEMNGKPKGITRIIESVLVGKRDKKKGNQDDGVIATIDTVDAVVKLTLRTTFSGFHALKRQISVAEKSLSPSLVERAKDVMEDVVIKFKGTPATRSQNSSMGKSDRNVTAEQEFAALEKVLIQTADDATRCLKLLKKNLSDYDSRHGNHFINTSTSYMRSDMRAAKDTAADLKRAAHEIKKSPQPSEAEIHSARNMMGATAKAMDILNTTARNYDQEKGRSKGVKGAVDNVVGHNDKERHENEGGFFGKDKEKESTGLIGKSDKHKDDKHTGLFGKDKDDKHTGLFGKGDKHKDEKHTGLFGKGDKHNKHGDGLLGGKTDHHHDGHRGGVFSGSDTVEALVKSTLRENFNLSALSHQITIAEKSLSSSPSFVERAKEAVHEVKEKLTGDKSSSTSDKHHAHKHGVTP